MLNVDSADVSLIFKKKTKVEVNQPNKNQSMTKEEKIKMLESYKDQAGVFAVSFEQDGLVFSFNGDAQFNRQVLELTKGPQCLHICANLLANVSKMQEKLAQELMELKGGIKGNYKANKSWPSRQVTIVQTSKEEVKEAFETTVQRMKENAEVDKSLISHLKCTLDDANKQNKDLNQKCMRLKDKQIVLREKLKKVEPGEVQLSKAVEKLESKIIDLENKVYEKTSDLKYCNEQIEHLKSPAAHEEAYQKKKKEKRMEIIQNLELIERSRSNGVEVKELKDLNYSIIKPVLSMSEQLTMERLGYDSKTGLDLTYSMTKVAMLHNDKMLGVVLLAWLKLNKINYALSKQKGKNTRKVKFAELCEQKMCYKLRGTKVDEDTKFN